MTKRISQNTNLFQASVVCGLAALFVMLQFTLQISPSVMISQLMKSFSIDVVKMSILSSSYFYTYLILQIPSGILVDKYGPRKVIVCSVFLCAIGCLLFSFADDFLVAVGLRMFLGFASAPAIAVAFYLCARWFPPYLFAISIGLVETTAALGVAFANYALGLIVISDYGWRGAILAMFALGVILFILITSSVYDSKKEELEENKDSKFTVIQLLMQVIKQPQVWIVGVYCGMLFVVVSGFASLWCVPYLQALYNVGLVDAAIGSSAIFMGVAFGAPLSGWLSDHMGRRKPVMLVGAIVTFFMTILVVYHPPSSIGYMYALLSALGFFSGVYMVPFSVIKDITSSDSQGTAMGFTNMMCIFFGAPIFQPLVSVLLANSSLRNSPIAGELVIKANDYQCAFKVLPICILAGVVTVFFIKETYCNNPKAGQSL